MAKKQKGAPSLEEQIREAISSSGLTPTDLAKRAGVALPQVTRFVKGERSVSLDTAWKLCRVLGLKLVREGPPSGS